MLATLTLSGRSRIAYTIAVAITCFLIGLFGQKIYNTYNVHRSRAGAGTIHSSHHTHSGPVCAHHCSKCAQPCTDHSHHASEAHLPLLIALQNAIVLQNDPGTLSQSARSVLGLLYLNEAGPNPLLSTLGQSHCCFCGQKRLYIHLVGYQMPHLGCCPCSAMYAKIGYSLFGARFLMELKA